MIIKILVLTINIAHIPNSLVLEFNKNFFNQCYANRSTSGDFHCTRVFSKGHASPPSASTLTHESAPRSRLEITLSGSCCIRAGVICSTVTNCLRNSTLERERGDCLTLVGTMSRQAPDDNARNICSF